MDEEPSWSMDRLQTSLSCKHLLPTTSSSSLDQMHGAANIVHDPMYSGQSAEYCNLSTFHKGQDMNTADILELQTTGAQRLLGYQDLSQLNEQEYPAMFTKVQGGQSGHLRTPFDVDPSLPEDVAITSQMQSLRDFMVANNLAGSPVPSISGAQQYQFSQGDDQVTLLDPRSLTSLPLYFNLIDDASASPPTAPQQLRPSLPSRPEIMNLRNLYSGELFGGERSPHRTQLQRESHILAERQRREEMNDKFTILRSMIPKLTKKDKASIVTDTINYIKELEKKVTYLQACKGKAQGYLKPKRKPALRLELPASALEKDLAILEDRSKEVRRASDCATSTIEVIREGDDGKQKLGQVEVQGLGNEAVIKIISARSRGVVLRLHVALENCKVDVLQSNVTTAGNNVIHFLTVGLNPGISATMDELIAALRLASSPVPFD